MPTVSLLAKVTAQEGKGDELVAAFEPLIEQVRKEPGTLLYAVNRSKDKPDVCWTYELYTDDEALAAHGASDAMAKAGPTLGPLIAESELILGEPVLDSQSADEEASMAKVALLARFRANEGKADELIAAFQPLIEQVEKEPGTVLYVMNRSKDDPDLFWFSELYTDDDAFAAHGSSDAMAKAMPTLGPLIAESELILGEPVLGKGLPSS